MSKPIVYGPNYSTYVRTARLALEEKGVAYDLSEVDMMKGECQKPEYLARQPFAKVPAFQQDGFSLYETTAIARYVDEAFPGPKLQPADAKKRARMAQIVSIVDSYGYGCFIGKVVWQRVVVPLMGGKPDETIIKDALPQAEKTVAALEALADSSGPYLCGSEISLADLHLGPVIAYFNGTPEGQKLMAGAPKLSRWWKMVSTRPSFTRTEPKLG
jgi:glutathione S-transferase